MIVFDKEIDEHELMAQYLAETKSSIPSLQELETVWRLYGKSNVETSTGQDS